MFHSTQVPPAGFNRGHYNNPAVDGLLDRASVATTDLERRALYSEVQKIIADEAPYISLWHKTNAVVAGRSLGGISLLPTADFTFLKDVARTN